MAIHFACECGKKLAAPKEKVGKQVYCTACGKGVTVPKSKSLFGDDDLNPTVLAKQFATTILPGLVAVVAICVIGYWLSNKFLGGQPNYPTLAPVSGTVTLDSQPLAGAEVLFEPEDGFKEGTLKAASTGVTDEAGHYTLYYVKDVPGAVVGKHRVEISKVGNKGEVVPARYHGIATELDAEVTDDGKPIDFPLTSQ